MAIPCPACNKPDQTGATCARCGCDLSPLHAVVEAAAERLSDARTALQSTNWPSALARAEQAWHLCHTVEAARLAFLAAGALGDTAGALRWHERARRN